MSENETSNAATTQRMVTKSTRPNIASLRPRPCCRDAGQRTSRRDAKIGESTSQISSISLAARPVSSGTALHDEATTSRI